MDQHVCVQVVVTTVKKKFPSGKKKHNLCGCILSVILLFHHLRI